MSSASRRLTIVMFLLLLASAACSTAAETVFTDDDTMDLAAAGDLTADATIEDQPGFLFVGVSQEDGKPLAGAQVWCGDQVATTGAEGNISFLWLTSGEYVVRVEAAGYCSRTERIVIESGMELHKGYSLRQRTAPVTFQADAGVTVNRGGIDVELQAGGAVKPDGAPAAGTLTLRADVFLPRDQDLNVIPAPWFGINVEGYVAYLEPVAALDLELSDAEGAPLQPAEGKPIQVTVPVPSDSELTAGAVLNLWGEYPELGGWLEDPNIQGTVVDDGGTLVLKASIPHLSKFVMPKKVIPTPAKPTQPVSVKPPEVKVDQGIISSLNDGRACPRLGFSLTGYTEQQLLMISHDFLYECEAVKSYMDTGAWYYFKSGLSSLPPGMKGYVRFPFLSPSAIPSVTCRLYYGGLEVSAATDQDVYLKYPNCANDSYTLIGNETKDTIQLGYSFASYLSLDSKLGGSKRANLHVHSLNGCAAARLQAKVSLTGLPGQATKNIFNGEILGHQQAFSNLVDGTYMVQLFQPDKPNEAIGTPHTWVLASAPTYVGTSGPTASFGIYDYPNTLATKTTGGCQLMDCVGPECDTCVKLSAKTGAGDPLKDVKVRLYYRKPNMGGTGEKETTTGSDGWACLNLPFEEFDFFGSQRQVSVETRKPTSQMTTVTVLPQTSCDAGNCATIELNLDLERNQCPATWMPISGQTRSMGFLTAASLLSGYYPALNSPDSYFNMTGTAAAGGLPTFIPAGKLETTGQTYSFQASKDWYSRLSRSLVVLTSGPGSLGIIMQLAPLATGTDCPSDSRGGALYAIYQDLAARTYLIQEDFANKTGNTKPYTMVRVLFENTSTSPATRLGSYRATGGWISVSKFEFSKVLQFTYSFDLTPEPGTGGAAFTIAGSAVAPWLGEVPKTVSNQLSRPEPGRILSVSTEFDALFGPTENNASKLDQSLQQCLTFTWWEPKGTDSKISYCVPPDRRFRLGGSPILGGARPFTAWFKYLKNDRFVLDGNSDPNSWMYTTLNARWFDESYMNTLYEKNGLGAGGWKALATIVGVGMKGGMALPALGEVKLACGSSSYIACHLLNDFTCSTTSDSPVFAFLAVPPDLECTLTIKDKSGTAIGEMQQNLRTVASGAMLAHN